MNDVVVAKRRRVLGIVHDMRELRIDDQLVIAFLPRVVSLAETDDSDTPQSAQEVLKRFQWEDR